MWHFSLMRKLFKSHVEISVTGRLTLLKGKKSLPYSLLFTISFDPSLSTTSKGIASRVGRVVAQSYEEPAVACTSN